MMLSQQVQVREWYAGSVRDTDLDSGCQVQNCCNTCVMFYTLHCKHMLLPYHLQIGSLHKYLEHPIQ